MNNTLKITLFVFLIISVAVILSILSLQFFAPKQRIGFVNNFESNKESAPGTKMEEKILDENKDAVSEAQAKTNNRVQPVSKDDNLIGSADAKVKIIVYSDFECPFCATLSDSLQKVRKNFNGRASIAFRHFPLLSHSNALPAALAAECAGEQSKFWEMHDRLFADNISKNLNLDQYKKGAKELKLDIVKFSQCLETEKYKTKIEEQMLGGRNSGVTGAPTVFVNNEIYPGAMPYEDFTTSDGQTAEGLKSIIERLLK